MFLTWTNKPDLRMRLVWRAVIAIGAIHLLSLLTFEFFTLSGAIVCAVLFVICGMSITLGYHRLFTHWSFEVKPWLMYTIAAIGSTNWQGGVVMWAGIHRRHHQHSDGEHDPHSPLHGGFDWAHVFWVFFKPVGYNPEVLAGDLLKDPGLKLINKYFWVPQFLLIPILFGLGYWYKDVHTGISWVVMGVFLRTVAVYFVTWLINSWCHMYGDQPNDTGDDSRNISGALGLIMSLLTFGECWHNNHHYNQRSAAHGFRWYQLDPTYWVIRLLGFAGLAWNIIKPDGTVLYERRSSRKRSMVEAA